MLLSHDRIRRDLIDMIPHYKESPLVQKVSVHFLLLFLSYVPFPLPFHAFHPDTFPCLRLLSAPEGLSAIP